MTTGRRLPQAILFTWQTIFFSVVHPLLTPFQPVGLTPRLTLYLGEFSCCCTLTTQCNDGIDNDGDGSVDFPADTGCTNACDSLETFLDQCKDGIDNDGDGLSDYPADCGCESESDTSEAPNAVTQCNDGIDNDGDGLIDLADTNCVDSCDFNEFTLCLARPGNANGDAGQAVNLVDIIFVVGKVFKSGPASNPLCATNANGDGVLANLTDIVYLVNYVFKGGPAPIPSGVCCL